MHIWNALYKVFFVILFIFALYATFALITNLTIFDVYRWMNASATANASVVPIVEEQRFQEKTFPKHLQSEPVNHSILLQDVKALDQVLDFNQYPKQTVIATGYTAGEESTGKTPEHPGYGITFSGIQVKRDVYSTIAADLNIFPLGTILYIPGYGYGVVADKGGAIQGNKIDLYYETVDDVYNEWGKKEVDVYIIQLGNGELTNEQFSLLNHQESLQVLAEQIYSQ